MNFDKHNTFLESIVGIRVYLLFMIIVLVSTFSCQSSKFLNDNENHLEKNIFDFKGKVKNNEKQKLESGIISLNIQKPNSKWLFIPREYIYYKNTEVGDSSWFNRFARKQIGEIPSIYNKEKTENTVSTIKNYLVNRKGYFDANVDYKVALDSLHREMTVQYDIDLKKRYTIKSLKYISSDTVILAIIKAHQSYAHIKRGDPIDEGFFNLETSRISNLLQNNGYADFNSKFIQIKGDSTDNKQSVDIIIEIKTPAQELKHEIYKIGIINVYTDFNQSNPLEDQHSTTIHDGIHFDKKSDAYIVKLSLLSSMIYMRPGDLYSKSIRQKTYRKLLQLNHPLPFVTQEEMGPF